MKGLSVKAAKAVERLMGSKFDSISLRMLGFIPKPSKEKSIVFQTTRDNLISLFLQALGNRNPNQLEEQTLKVLLGIANGYMNGLKERTTSRVIHDIDSYVRDKNISKKPVSSKKINNIINEHLGKAKNHVGMIASAESHKAVNTGTALQISKLAKQKNDDDPVVYFVVHRDERNHKDTLRLHLLPDGITPRVWRLSELNHGYHTMGADRPTVGGTHPYCRCFLTYLAPGYSFNEKGKIKFKGLDWDEFKYQRKNYEMPKDETKK